MKKILFASTALAGLAIGGAASADITLFGDARLGIGYNIGNGGGLDIEDTRTETVDVITIDPVTGDEIVTPTEVVTERGGTEDLRAISRVRFGVNMTGETDSGITFGATIRADNARGGQGGDDNGQTAGEVFVSGAWGTLTFGDTSGADEQHVGDAGGNLSVTGLGDFNETPFVSNGGGFGDDAIQFANNPEARPTVRYDYNFGGFGVSASTNRSLNDIGVGASYTLEFDEGSVTGGVGYYDFNEFDTTFENGLGDDVDATVKGGEQFSVGLTGTFSGFSGGVVYTAASSDSDNDNVSGDLDVLNVGLGYTLNEWGFSAYYATIMTGNGAFEAFDGNDSYGIAAAYDLGGGASVNAGVAKTYGRSSVGDPTDPETFFPEVEDAYVADFGIKMSF